MSDPMTGRAPASLAALPPGSRVLITGGSGFIGANLVDALAPHASVLNIDLLPPRMAAHSAHWTRLDIRECSAVLRAVQDFRPDFVFHAAARTDLDGRRPEDYQTNTAGTEALLDALAATDFRGAAVFFSSMLTNRPGLTSSSLGQGDPDTAYGASKLVMEEKVLAARLPYRWSVVRPTSIWGPGFGEPYLNFFRMVLGGRYVNPGPRTATKTFGFVLNTISQLLAIATLGRSVEAPLYLGDEPPSRISDWAREIAMLAGVTAPRTLPAFAGSLAAFSGDMLERCGIKAPLTTRRLMNMTRDNVVDLEPVMAIAPPPPFTRTDGTQLTLRWISTLARAS